MIATSLPAAARMARMTSYVLFYVGISRSFALMPLKPRRAQSSGDSWLKADCAVKANGIRRRG